VVLVNGTKAQRTLRAAGGRQDPPEQARGGGAARMTAVVAVVAGIASDEAASVRCHRVT
jgi:hypothetical protein